MTRKCPQFSDTAIQSHSRTEPAWRPISAFFFGACHTVITIFCAESGRCFSKLMESEVKITLLRNTFCSQTQIVETGPEDRRPMLRMPSRLLGLGSWLELGCHQEDWLLVVFGNQVKQTTVGGFVTCLSFIVLYLWENGFQSPELEFALRMIQNTVCVQVT